MSGHTEHSAAFVARLERCRRAWRRGLALALFLRAAGWGATAFALYFAADYALALGEATRACLNVALPVALAAAAVPEALRLRRIGLGEAAAQADRIGGHRRNEALTAWELLSDRKADGARGAPDALPAFLLERSVAAAAERLAALDPRALRPRALVARRARRLLLQGLLAATVLLAGGEEVLRTVLPRLLWPGRDVPPYSRYRFEVRPQAPSILYGGAAEVAVTISGAAVADQVWLFTRRPGQQVQRAACFRDGAGRYAQRLENVTQPVQFCFAVGRARSRWHAAELRTQPQITRARIRLAPPPYTRLPPREFAAGQETVAGVRGTRVTLTLTSNRPLREGSVALVGRRGAKGSDRVVAARLASERTAAFEWTLESDADAKATLRDVRGTPTAEPLVVPQSLLPDEPPGVALSEPPEFSLATPSAVIKVAGRAEDDFGIERLDWVRAVVGFRDRAVALDKAAGEARAEFETELDLGKLGAQAGQVLEFYAEALDNNPFGHGVGSTALARVKVISEGEYAEMLRNRETLEQFLARYEEASATIGRILARLQELKATAAGGPEREALAAAVKRSVQAHMAAEALFQQLARDFDIYEAEQALSRTSESLLGKLGENRAELEELMRAPGRDDGAKIERMIQRLKGDAEALGREARSAAWLVDVARVMDGAARFQALVRRQEALVRRLEQRYGAAASSADLPYLAGYGSEQAAVAQALAALAGELAAAVQALPGDAGPLKADTAAFLGELERCGAARHMEESSAASRNSDARSACREARLALEKLQGLLGSDNEACSNVFASLCRGREPGFGSDDLKRTLQAMFRALCRKRGLGQGQGEGSGLGVGGESEDGYSELATPVYGPGRSRSDGLGTLSGQGKGERGAGARGAGGDAAVSERLRAAERRAPAGESLPFERLPPKYREAVKRYFEGGSEGGEP